MTKEQFTQEEALIITLLGQQFALNPTVLKTGTCVYRSVPVSLWVPTSTGKILVDGTFTLKPWRSKTWQTR